MKKKYAGYIHLKPLNGVIYPSSIQNIIMKNFCRRKILKVYSICLQLNFYNQNMQLHLILFYLKIQKLLVLLCYQSFVLPKSFTERKNLYTKLFSSKKIIFILDELSLKK